MDTAGNQTSRILMFDLENSPLVSYTWGVYDQNVIQVRDQWVILSFAYRWYGESKTHVVSLPDFPGYQNDKMNDYHLVKRLHELIDEADAICAHNLEQFDFKKANARFAVHQLTPPSPVKMIDTLKIARRYFLFSANKLDSLGEILGVGRKGSTHGFQTWLDAMAGDEKAWKVLTKYNIQDVDLLCEIYTRLRPWMTNHPNVNLGDFDGNLDACPKCGSANITKQGFKFNKTTTNQQYRCSDCGGWSSSRISERTLKPSLVN